MDQQPEDSDSKLPLHDEAVAREKWRGGETLLHGDGAGHGSPASEVDEASGGSGGSGGDDGRPCLGGPGSIPPPD